MEDCFGKNYSQDYSESSFWKKLSKYAVDAGHEVVEEALVLFYSLEDQQVPAWAKSTILFALGYFISPVDAIPDFIPVLGYTDDLAVLTLAFGTIRMYVSAETVARAKRKAVEWFGSS